MICGQYKAVTIDSGCMLLYHLAITSGVTLCCLSAIHPVMAQISADNKLPDGQTVVSPGAIPGLDFVITGGTQAGSNLFHSFTEFSVPTNGSAIFNNQNPGIQNIIGRVTGGVKSNINGLIQANNNLFLINPNGIVFGPNAVLDINGSFIASTASSLKLSNGDVFSATNPTSPLLTISVPLGLQFGSQAGDIKVEGYQDHASGDPLLDSPLLVQPFTTLALVGGEISINGQSLVAPGGRVELGSVGDNNFVSLTPSSQGFGLGYAGVQNFQKLQLDGSSIDVSGPGGGNVQIQGQIVTLNQTQVFANTAPNGTETGGGITIRGNQLSFNDSTVQAATFSSVTGGDVNLVAHKLTVQGPSAIISAETADIGQGGNLIIRADDVQLADLSILGTETKGLGAGGDVTIEAKKLSIQDGAQIAVNTSDRGSGGKLTVKVADSINLVGEGELFDTLYSSGLIAETRSSGKGGEVIVETLKLSIRDGGSILASTFADGAAGSIKILAAETELISSPTVSKLTGVFNQVEPGATGQGGNITLDTEKLLIQGGARVSTSTFSAGDGGSIFVKAPNLVRFWGETTDQNSSGLFAQVEPGATGQGGNVTIDTGQLILQGNQALISASTDGVGMGGNVTINTISLVVRDGAQIQAASQGQAPGGIVNVTAKDTIQLIGTSVSDQSPGGLFTSTLGKAPAGNLNVNTSNLLIQDGARISASTFGEGIGGNITINVSDGVNLIGTSPNGETRSGLFVQATGTGRAGNINLTAGHMLLARGGEILAETAADDGGEISLRVNNILQMRNNNLISATAGSASKQGNGGNININTTFLIANPLGDNDITANAFEGRGGNIQITAQSVFGLKFREQLTPSSDITASSTFGVNGVVEIETPNVDPSKGLSNLPTQVTDNSKLIAQSCKANQGQMASSFVVTGRGGLPSSPEAILSSDTMLQDLETTPIQSSQNITQAKNSPSPPPISHPIVEAQAIVVNSRGEVFLTAHAPTTTPYSTWSPSTNCYAH
jgi:filamentous hemagglutinin family protein